MCAITVPPGSSPAPSEQGPHPRRWTREEYYRAAELGLFGPEERLELLDGEIIQKMSPQKPPHAVAVGQAGDILSVAFGSGCHIRTEKPLILNVRSEPEPDVVVAPGKRADYLLEHPRAADVLLVIEIADTTLRFDRTRKMPAYARVGVREYWIINLLERQVEVYRDPSGSRYRSRTIHHEGEMIIPLTAPNASVSISDLLPPSVPEQG